MSLIYYNSMQVLAYTCKTIIVFTNTIPYIYIYFQLNEKTSGLSEEFQTRNADLEQVEQDRSKLELENKDLETERDKLQKELDNRNLELSQKEQGMKELEDTYRQLQEELAKVGDHGN